MTTNEEEEKDEHANTASNYNNNNNNNNNTIDSVNDKLFLPIQRVKFYSHVRQRQNWGEKQILPRVNWGDLFFDLFYVAAAYNATNILQDAPTGRGLLYFLATFLSAMDHWLFKMTYDGRFVLPDDLAHRAREIVHLCMLSTVVLHIRPLTIMEDSLHNIDMFSFCLANALGHFFYICDYLELYFFGIGQTVPIRNCAKTEMKRQTVATLFYLAAAIYAGIIYHSTSSHDSPHSVVSSSTYAAGGHRFLAEQATTTTHATTSSHTSNYTNTTTGGDYGNSAHGEGASYGSYGQDNAAASLPPHHDLPIILCLVAHIVNWAGNAIFVIFCFPKHAIREKFVPINVDFVIHRSGEWTMLMLGESLLTILIADIDGDDSTYWQTMLCALTTVLLLKYLHFTSQPHHADQHAVRRSKNAAALWTIFHQVYSVAYLGLSSAFGMFLNSFTGTVDLHAAAMVFSISLALIFLSIDVMNLLHLGVSNTIVRCYCYESNEINFFGILIILARLGMIGFACSLFTWINDPEWLSVIGLASVFFQLMLRKLGYMYLVAGQESAVSNIRSSLTNTMAGGFHAADLDLSSSHGAGH